MLPGKPDAIDLVHPRLLPPGVPELRQDVHPVEVRIRVSGEVSGTRLRVCALGGRDEECDGRGVGEAGGVADGKDGPTDSDVRVVWPQDLAGKGGGSQRSGPPQRRIPGHPTDRTLPRQSIQVSRVLHRTVPTMPEVALPPGLLVSRESGSLLPLLSLPLRVQPLRLPGVPEEGRRCLSQDPPLQPQVLRLPGRRHLSRLSGM